MEITDALRDDLWRAKHVVVFTGAGVSAESGIATFRDALTGLWSRFDPAELATAEAFRRHPAICWGWYEWRRAAVLRAQPNAAHRAIAALGARVPALTLVTQNVDDLHERAGSSDVLHLHGSLHRPRCFDCGLAVTAMAPPSEPAGEGAAIEPPRCDRCGGPWRPGVVWFGESLPEDSLAAAFSAAERCDLLLSVGTSGVVYPAAEVPAHAWRNGATVAYVNPQGQPLFGEREHVLRGAAGVCLPALLAACWPQDEIEKGPD